MMEEQTLRNANREILVLREMVYFLEGQLNGVQKKCDFEKRQNVKLCLKFDRVYRDEETETLHLIERSERELQNEQEKVDLELLCLKGELAFLELQLKAFQQRYYFLRHENVKMQMKLGQFK